MAWVNIEIEGITTGTIADGSTKFYQNFSYTNRSGVMPSDLSWSTTKTQSQINSTTSGSYLVGDVHAGLQVHDRGIYFRGDYNYQYWDSALTDTGGDDYCIFAGINEETHRGTIFGFGRWSNERWSITDGSCFNSEGVYNILKALAPIPPIVYNWQSVPSISGKNGILQSLVQIKEEALNDGEPVSEATVLSFDSLGNINIPSVIDEQMPVDPSDVTSVTATYLIPALENGTYEGIKLLVKKGSIPTSEEDADKVVNLSEPTSVLRIDSKSVGNLDEDSHYYFMVKLIDELGTEATSDPKDIWTSHSEGWSFDYTGEIQTFVAPKTGIYSLETWGAQGGDATDGTNSARGGYGAYAVGEVFLTQGDTLYINVGGQNGYGGGGNGEISYDFLDIAKYSDISQQIYQEQTAPFNISALSGYYLTNNILCIGRPLNLNWSENLGEMIKPVDRDSDCQKNWYFPINRVTNVKKISFDIYLEDVTYEYWAFAIIWIKWVENDTMSTNSDILRIGNFGTPGTYQYFGQWKHFEIDVNVQQMDYLTISTGRDVVKIKNIVITCST